MSAKIDQAFIDAYTDAGLGLAIAHENLHYDPVAGTEYVELINLPNDTTALSLNDINETDGLFRVILRWPIDKGSINAKLKADEIFAAFTIGSDVCYEGQCATITSTARNRGVLENGWYKTVLTIGYYASISY